MRLATDGPLLTDLYELTMMQAYLERGQTDEAVFEFFVRRLPAGRNFLVFAGLAQALDYLERLRFAPRELDALRADGRFDAAFIDYLSKLRFTGSVRAMREGTVFFADEPVLQVAAPLPVAQFVESRLINLLQFQTMVASKAVRCVLAARPGSLLVDFGMRRSHGAEAALMAARATYIAGFDGTSNVLAGIEFGIPLYGTMAHAYVLAHDDEDTAFLNFAHCHPDNAVLLIDTYDTERAASRLPAVAERLARDGIRIQAVRIDSGDLDAHARAVRRILDEAGLKDVRIFASGDLDETALARLGRAPIDGYGVGTRLDTSADAPYLDCAYKLQEYAGIARRKRAEGKATWPGRKQVFRHYRDGRIEHDLLALSGEDAPPRDRPLLETVMSEGRRTGAPPSPIEIRDHLSRELLTLPDDITRLETIRPSVPLRISRAVRDLAEAIDRRPPSSGI